ncbi:hypothetical protein CDAR_579481 [Caerostris darwini]|uniref:Uncharacterized protein n=1 Tax=Caerostris darwini TaxID=1538125 RepID=A0AAV4V3C0_9ARAC|nr:hypothetical protein CDAR_579481 [Caerostris darwini]
MTHSMLTLSASKMICRPIKEGFRVMYPGGTYCRRNGRRSLCDIYVSLLKVEWLPIKFSDVEHSWRIHDPRRHLKCASIVNDPCQPPKAMIRGEDDALSASKIIYWPIKEGFRVYTLEELTEGGMEGDLYAAFM